MSPAVRLDTKEVAKGLPLSLRRKQDHGLSHACASRITSVTFLCMLRDEWQETEADVLRICRELAKLGPKIRAAKADKLDAVQVEVLAKIRELIRASDALLEAAVKEAGLDDREGTSEP